MTRLDVVVNQARVTRRCVEAFSQIFKKDPNEHCANRHTDQRQPNCRLRLVDRLYSRVCVRRHCRPRSSLRKPDARAMARIFLSGTEIIYLTPFSVFLLADSQTAHRIRICKWVLVDRDAKATHSSYGSLRKLAKESRKSFSLTAIRPPVLCRAERWRVARCAESVRASIPLETDRDLHPAH